MNKELNEGIRRVFEDNSYKIIISKPKSGGQAEYQKLNILLKGTYYQAECYTQKQVFHFNYSREEAEGFCQQILGDQYLQLNAWSEGAEHQILISKKGKVSCKSKKASGGSKPKEQSSHNRKKQYLLPEGEAIPPLVDMGIFSAEGKVNPSMYDKYKQINRFMEIVDDALKTYAYDPARPLKIVDFGCGKSYLTFILYYFFTRVKHIKVRMIGLDLKEDVIDKCNKAAVKYGYTDLQFQIGDIGCYQDDIPADMVITLHACDTATDHALFHAVKWKASMIFSVPCCQHELNSQYQAEQLALIGRYGIVKERTMALMTDAIRANLLECCGYKTQLMEFVDFENTPKNLLIRAVRRKNIPARIDVSGKGKKQENYYQEVREALDVFHTDQTFYRLLKEAGYLEKYEQAKA